MVLRNKFLRKKVIFIRIELGTKGKFILRRKEGLMNLRIKEKLMF